MNQKGIGNRLLSLVLMMAMVISLLPGMGITVHAVENTAVTGVTLSPSDPQPINVGEKVSFTATVSPEEATDKTVKWNVSGTDSGAVELYSDENCNDKVTLDVATSTLTVYAKGISAGSATVTCTSNENANKFATSTVTVNAAATVTTYSVTITAGNNMTLADGSGDASQTGLSGTMTDVVYTANEGYYFPTDYNVVPVSGISVTRNSYTQITIGGTPTASTELTLTAATEKITPAAPTTAAAVNCTTTDNNDGKLTGITTAMEYQKSGDESWTPGTGNDITGLVPGTYYVRLKATDTENASANQELTIAGYAAPIEYSLWVDNVRVTNANMSDVLAGDPKNEGKVSFTPAEGTTPATLTLRGATITAGHHYGDGDAGIFYNGAESLDIVLEEGTVNTVNPTGTNPVGIFSSSYTAYLSISGNGTIIVTGSAHGIACANNITIGGGTVTVSGTGSGGDGIHSESGNVNITGGTVIANNTADHGIGITCGDTKMIIIGEGVTSVVVAGAEKAFGDNVKNSKAGAGWTNTAGTEGKGVIETSSEARNLSQYRKVVFPTTVEYPLWVGGIRVTSDNASNITDSYPAVASYDDLTNTLTLSGVIINTKGDRSGGIEYDGKQSLTINLADGTENSIALLDNGIISNKNSADLTITGAGKLLTTTYYSGIYSSGDLIIESGSIESYTSSNGYSILGGKDVTVNGGTITASSSNSSGYGIYAKTGDALINGGNVTASSKYIGLAAEGDVIISSGTVTASATADGGCGILSETGGVTITGGIVSATANVTGNVGGTGIYLSSDLNVVDISGDNVTVIGSNIAINGKVKNSTTGTGWTNTAGTEGQGVIETSSTARDLSQYKYKKVVFPAADVHMHDDISFTAWTATDSLPTAAGNYYLVNDVALSSTWNGLNGNINLCLNGKTISVKDGPTQSNDQGIYVSGVATLDLYDCKESGTIKPVDGYKGRCFDVVGTLNMHGGTICGFGDEKLVKGAAVEIWNDSGAKTFNMYGGTISGNTAQSGSAVYGVSGSLFNMSGGTISGNTSIDNTTGAVHMRGSFTMSGGSITQNTKGGVAIDSDGTIKVSGNPSVTGNTGSNLYLGTTHSSEQKKIEIIGDGLQTNAKLGITMEKPGIFTAGLSGKGGVTNFTSDSSNYGVALVSDSGEAKLTNEYTVIFNPNGGTGDVYTQEIAKGKTVQLTANSFTRENYEFVKWNTQADGQGTSSFDDEESVKDIADPGVTLNLYAQWEKVYAVNVAESAHGTFVPDYEKAPEKEQIYIRVEPEAGYEVDEITVKNDTTGTNIDVIHSFSGYEFKMPASSVTISGKFIRVYLYVDGVRVTDENKESIPVTAGTASFDPATSTLTLNNASITNTGLTVAGIYSEDENLNLTINGSGQITLPESPMSYGIGIGAGGPLTINGNITISGGSSGIECYDSLTINGGTINSSGSAHGIYAKEITINSGTINSSGSVIGINTQKITINGGTVTAHSDSELLGAIVAINGITYASSHGITTPVGGKTKVLSYMENPYTTVVDTNENVAKDVVIEKMKIYNPEVPSQTWTSGSSTGVTFRFVGSKDDEKTYKNFSAVELDNVIVGTGNYKAEPGSVKITFTPQYLNTLGEGSHTIKALFTDGAGTATLNIVKKSSGGGSTPAKKKDNVVTCQMAGFPANYAWNEAAKACQPGYLDAGGNFHSYSNAKRSTVPNTSDNGNLTFYTIAMFLMTFVAYITAKKLTEDSRA